MEKKYKVGIIGATGMVGQRFVTLMENHPWFQLTVLAASPRSAGQPYEQAVAGRWAMDTPIPAEAKELVVMDAQADVEKIAGMVDFVFCAVDMKKDEIRALEERYAKAECPVVSNNSAHRWTEDVPRVVPEMNPEVFMKFADGKAPSMEQIKADWAGFKGRAQELDLPSAPKQFLHYFEEPDRPQAKLDRELEGGMAVSLGRLRPDTQYDYKFVGLSHNTLRGAAGGAVLLAELLCAEGYMDRK